MPGAVTFDLSQIKSDQNSYSAAFRSLINVYSSDEVDGVISQIDLSELVPYEGATEDLDLGDNVLNAAVLQSTVNDVTSRLVTSGSTLQIDDGLGGPRTINHFGNYQWAVDNTYDIGASGQNRPRNVYVGTSVLSPLFEAGGTAQTTIGNTTGGVSVPGIVTTSGGLKVGTGASYDTTGKIYMQSASGTDRFLQMYCIGTGNAHIGTGTQVPGLVIDMRNDSSGYIDLQVRGNSALKVNADRSLTIKDGVAAVTSTGEGRFTNNLYLYNSGSSGNHGLSLNNNSLSLITSGSTSIAMSSSIITLSRDQIKLAGGASGAQVTTTIYAPDRSNNTGDGHSVVIRAGYANSSGTGGEWVGGNLTLLAGGAGQSNPGENTGGNVLIGSGAGYGTGKGGDVTISIAGGAGGYGDLLLNNIHTSDPLVPNVVWNENGVARISTGTPVEPLISGEKDVWLEPADPGVLESDTHWYFWGYYGSDWTVHRFDKSTPAVRETANVTNNAGVDDVTAFADVEALTYE